MAKRTGDNPQGFRGRTSRPTFDHLISPLGQDGGETPRYSPSEAVDGAKGKAAQPTRGPESLRNDRRGG